MEFASEAAYTFANVKKTKRLRASSLIVKRGRIEPRTTIGNDDAEHMRQTLFDPGNLAQPYHSINTDVHKRIRYLETVGD